MSVDYFTCQRCKENFNDCGDYVSCENCGTCWCCDDCAELDGYKAEYDENDEVIKDSCKYCRKEDFEDNVLLNKAMELLNCDREYLINKCKGE